MATTFAKVNRTILERGRGIPNGMATIRRQLKSQVVTIITDTIASDKKNELADTLNKYADTARTNGFPYAHNYIRSFFGLTPKTSDPITQEEINSVIAGPKSLSLPIVEVVPEICEKCTDDVVSVTDLCMSCTSHPCHTVCPADAVRVFEGRTQKTVIDPAKCIRCEQCIKVCPYDAIVHRYRPCKGACGVDAIVLDKDQRSVIRDSHCVSCGLCTVACPFGAIVHKSEVGVVAAKLANKNRKRPLAAIVAPAFVNQFGRAAPAEIFEGIKKLGFDSVVEVAYGADLDTVEIAGRLVEKIAEKKLEKVTEEDSQNSDQNSSDNSDNPSVKPEKLKGGYVGTSCCPSWVKTVRKHFPSQAENIAPSFAPMTETAQALKRTHPNIEIVFVGPCIAKVMEILEEPMKGLVEHAITFEELQSLFDAKKVNMTKTKKQLNQASMYGRGYACAGGVADAVAKAAEKLHGVKNVKKYAADTLYQCRRMLKGLEDGTIQADLVEGMACPGGCIGGAGVCAPPNKTKAKVLQFKAKAKMTIQDSIKQNYKSFEEQF